MFDTGFTDGEGSSASYEHGWLRPSIFSEGHSGVDTSCSIIDAFSVASSTEFGVGRGGGFSGIS